MTTKKTNMIKALLVQHGDDDLLPLAIEADEHGWGDIFEYLRLGYAEGLPHGGLWQCEHCGCPVEDPAHPDHGEGCCILADGEGGDTKLCNECYDEAKAARAKVVLTEEIDEEGERIGMSEDDSALTDDEKTLARYLDKNDEGNARNARANIGMYPRNKRYQLYRYQDKIDAANRAKGKKIN